MFGTKLLFYSYPYQPFLFLQFLNCFTIISINFSFFCSLPYYIHPFFLPFFSFYSSFSPSIHPSLLLFFSFYSSFFTSVLLILFIHLCLVSSPHIHPSLLRCFSLYTFFSSFNSVLIFSYSPTPSKSSLLLLPYLH